MDDRDAIDWEQLARRIGAIEFVSENAWSERGGVSVAREALVELIGSARLVAAVDHYVAFRPGFEVARSVLRYLRPAAAVTRCRELFDSNAPARQRVSAVDLLRDLADRSVLAWVPEFLADREPGVWVWGIDIVLQLAYRSEVDAEEVQHLLVLASAHQDERVRETAAAIHERFAETMA